MKKADIDKIVDKFVTKHRKGFLHEEILVVLESFPGIDMERFNDALNCISCETVKGKILIYPHDIKTALICGIEGREVSEAEFD